MKSFTILSVLFFVITGFITAQSSKAYEPTLESMSYLMNHVDTNLWNQKLSAWGLKVTKEKNENQVEYKKQAGDIYQYVGFDMVYGVLTIVWKDPSGKITISGKLKKELKGKESSTPYTYKINYGGVDYVVGVETKKDKGVYEMITMEVERK